MMALTCLLEALVLTRVSFFLLAIVENGVKLRLNIVDTPGYGDQVNNENWYGTCQLFNLWFSTAEKENKRSHISNHASSENSWEPIIKYIKDQHSSFLRKELTAMRDRYIQDTRIHCCLFFISPTGHS